MDDNYTDDGCLFRFNVPDHSFRSSDVNELFYGQFRLLFKAHTIWSIYGWKSTFKDLETSNKFLLFHLTILLTTRSFSRLSLTPTFSFFCTSVRVISPRSRRFRRIFHLSSYYTGPDHLGPPHSPRSCPRSTRSPVLSSPVTGIESDRSVCSENQNTSLSRTSYTYNNHTSTPHWFSYAYTNATISLRVGESSAYRKVLQSYVRSKRIGCTKRRTLVRFWKAVIWLWKTSARLPYWCPKSSACMRGVENRATAITNLLSRG